jgi:hypothetical protein
LGTLPKEDNEEKGIKPGTKPSRINVVRVKHSYLVRVGQILSQRLSLSLLLEEKVQWDGGMGEWF